ncbi:MAG: prolyl oligopeptidase family serine peptidase [Ilumatobacteraceae bacterium]
MSSDTFPKQFARTQRFTLGEPRNITVSADGERIIFARSTHGSDSINALWVLNSATGSETCVADPRTLLDDKFNTRRESNDLSDSDSGEERSRRERAREGANGIVGFSCDAEARYAVFTLIGRLFIADLQQLTSHEIFISPSNNTFAITDAIFDPRLSPDGKHIGYVRNGTLCVCDLDGHESVVAHDLDHEITWGQAEFVAAEEMERQRGFWWSPDGTMIAACRIDTSTVATVWISDVSRPESAPHAHRYPFAGTDNAHVELHIINLAVNLTDATLHVNWNHTEFPYLNAVHWSEAGLLIAIQSRDQRCVQMHTVNPTTGSMTLRHEETDGDWIELVVGVPLLLNNDQILHCAERNGSRALCIDGIAITEPTVQVRSVLGACNDVVLISFNPRDDPTVLHVARVDTTTHAVEILTDAPGIHGGSLGGDTVVISRTTLSEARSTTFVHNGPILLSHAETPLVQPNVTLHRVGDRAIATAIVLPHERTGEPLPVLFDPYGGPHAQRVIAAQSAYLTSQWFADQGFCVVIADGRGTPGRGSAWERSISGDLAIGILADQLEVLSELPQLVDNIDLKRVGIRGWSFGGYLAALAVLREPEHFHAAVAGAPVTDWRLYDTHYTERYLGHPSQHPDNYDASSLISSAGLLLRPLLLIHGLADDNVLAAHTLQLSSALLANGCRHEVLPLSGVTHMTPQEVVAENLLLHQLAFLKHALEF